MNSFEQMEAVIAQRRAEPQEGSYTCYLFEKGIDKILKKVESAIVEKGGAGRFGTWAYSYGYTLSAGLAQHAKNVLDGTADLTDMDDVASALQKYSPKAEWNGAGAKSENVFLIYQDTYIMGDPGKFMGNAEVEIPEKYFTIS